MDVLLQQSVNGIALGATYAVFAVGFTLLFGVLNVLNLAQGAVLMVGSLFGLHLAAAGLPLWAATLLAMAGAALVSAAIGALVFRPLERRGAHRWMGLVASLAAARLLVGLAQETSGTQMLRYPPVPALDGALPLAGARVGFLQLAVVGSALALMAGLALLLRRSRTGRALRALAFSPTVARLVGVRVEALTLLTWALTGALAAAAGVQLGLLYGAVSPFMGDAALLRGLTVLILGGLGSVPGAALAGFVLGLVETWTVAYLSSSFRDAVGFAAVFAVLALRPEGLFGRPPERRA